MSGMSSCPRREGQTGEEEQQQRQHQARHQADDTSYDGLAEGDENPWLVCHLREPLPRHKIPQQEEQQSWQQERFGLTSACRLTACGRSVHSVQPLGLAFYGR